MSKILDMIMLKLGYVPKEELDRCQSINKIQSRLYHKELKELNAIRAATIARAIQEARIVTMHPNNGYEVAVSQDGKTSPTEWPIIRFRDPVKPEYYRFVTDIDIATVKRVCEDVSPEDADFFVEGVIGEIRNNLTALMRMRS